MVSIMNIVNTVFMQWKLKEYLEVNNLKVYGLHKAIESTAKTKQEQVSIGMLYSIKNNKQKAAHFRIVKSIARGIYHLTGKRITPNDIFEIDIEEVD